MARYKAEYPPTTERVADVLEYLGRELVRIEAALDTIVDGLQNPVRAIPPKNEDVLVYGDANFDLGDGAGLYLRISGQWFKLEMTEVAGLHPSTGSVEAKGQIPTVS